MNGGASRIKGVRKWGGGGGGGGFFRMNDQMSSPFQAGSLMSMLPKSKCWISMSSTFPVQSTRYLRNGIWRFAATERSVAGGALEFAARPEDVKPFLDAEPMSERDLFDDICLHCHRVGLKIGLGLLKAGLRRVVRERKKHRRFFVLDLLSVTLRWTAKRSNGSGRPGQACLTCRPIWRWHAVNTSSGK